MKTRIDNTKHIYNMEYMKHEKNCAKRHKNPLAKILLATSVFTGLILLAAACNHSSPVTSPQTTGGTTPTTTGINRQLTAGGFIRTSLRTVNDCNALLEHFKSEALKIVGPYGLSGSEPPFIIFDSPGQPELLRSTTAAVPEAAGSDGGVPNFSTTNVQVKGVDEPDIIKTDGTRIVGISGGELWIVDPTNGNKVGSIKLGNTYDNIEFLLYKDKVVAFYTSSTFSTYAPTRLETDIASIPASVSGNAHIIEIDITNNTPRILNEVIIEGRYISARRVDNTVNFVLESRKSQELPFVSPINQNGEERAKESNRQVIMESSIEDWLPLYHLVNEQGGSVRKGEIAPCNKVRIPDEHSGLDVLSIVTIDLDSSLPEQGATSVIANGGTVYSSGKTLYVAHELYRNNFAVVASATIEPEIDSDSSSDLDSAVSNENVRNENEVWFHKFSTPAGGTAEYEASGGILGDILNQFSMHETADGHFWIVTTRAIADSSVENSERLGFVPTTSESFISSFKQEGEELMNVGQVGNIGKTEDVQSVRFIGDTAYVVTFRQIDPFYVVDLSQPENPRVLGELKIPGFSSYLHPLGNRKLLGVGSSATDEGRVTGGKLSLFDATDPTNPKEVAVLELGSGFSDVRWDHRAFLYWLPSERAFMPYGSYDNDFFGAIAIDVEADNAKLGEAGRFSHNNPQQCRGDNCGYQPKELITRTLVIGNTLWSLSTHFLEARDIDSLEKISSTQIAHQESPRFIEPFDGSGGVIP